MSQSGEVSGIIAQAGKWQQACRSVAIIATKKPHKKIKPIKPIKTNCYPIPPQYSVLVRLLA
jgi:hypothetical protein